MKFNVKVADASPEEASCLEGRACEGCGTPSSSRGMRGETRPVPSQTADRVRARFSGRGGEGARSELGLAPSTRNSELRAASHRHGRSDVRPRFLSDTAASASCRVCGLPDSLRDSPQRVH